MGAELRGRDEPIRLGEALEELVEVLEERAAAAGAAEGAAGVRPDRPDPAVSSSPTKRRTP